MKLFFIGYILGIISLYLFNQFLKWLNIKWKRMLGVNI